MPHAPRPVLPLLALLLALPACQTTRPAADTAADPSVPMLGPDEPGVLVDGDTAEWPSTLAAWSDEHALYFRFSVENQQLTLQSSGRTISILLDVDSSEATGSPASAPLPAMGIDLEVQFSPRKESGGTDSGVALLVHSGGSVQRYKADALDLAVSPTYAASWYEVRITRTPESPLGLPASGLLGPGAVRGVVALLDSSGQIEASAEPFSMTTAETCVGGRRLSDVRPPEKPAGALRVMTYNVEKGSPNTNPAPFRRIIEAIKPDVILFQEWDGADAAAVTSWFEKLTPSGQWFIAKANGDTASGGGVAIASRHPLTPLASGLSTSDNGAPKPVRFIGALVKAPQASAIVGAVHLKCCGSSGTAEDQRRMTEAKAVSALLQTTAAPFPAALRVVGGDLNLVGSRPPLDLLRAGIDADGSDLSVAQPQVLGDVTLTTWRGSDTPFPPGRLDYLAYSDANCEAVNAFVFDTSRFTDGALAWMGVQRGDSAATDHLAVVVDLLPH